MNSVIVAAEGFTLQSDFTDKISTILMNGANTAHPECSIIGTDGASGSYNKGTLNFYAGDVQVNGSILTKLAYTSNAKNFSVFHSDGVMMIYQQYLMLQLMLNNMIFL